MRLSGCCEIYRQWRLSRICSTIAPTADRRPPQLPALDALLVAMTSIKDFLIEAGVSEPKMRRGRQPWKPRNMLPLTLDVGDGKVTRGFHRCSFVLQLMTLLLLTQFPANSYV